MTPQGGRPHRGVLFPALFRDGAPGLQTGSAVGVREGSAAVSGGGGSGEVGKKLVTLLDLCVSSLRRGHANLLCIVPILTDDLRRESGRTRRRPGGTSQAKQEE